MVVIRIKNKRVKLFNLLLVIFVLLLIIFLILRLFFLLPFFTTKYNYTKNYEFYEVSNNLKIKRNIISCKLTEEKSVKIIDKSISNLVDKNLKEDGFKYKKNTYIRKETHFGFCGKYIKKYKKEYNDKYIDLKLNGNSKEKIKVLENYTDPYVSFKIDNKKATNISVSSNLNTNKTGTYIIAYTLNVSKSHKERLYRVINVYDDEKPVIELKGDESITLEYNHKYVEPGFKATDNLDGNITNKVKVKKNINVKEAGTYEVIYTVKDENNNEATAKRTVIIKEKNVAKKEVETKPVIKEADGITYVDGILIVNKDYGLPKEYNPGLNDEAYEALKLMQSDAKALNLNLDLVSGYRSYDTQEKLYNKYVKKDGEEIASTYSAQPGHSEHQTGLAFDVGSVSEEFADTEDGKWLAENAHLYGFIIRYPKDKSHITGYIYEPWHIRYLGVDIATKVKKSGLTLEEYLKIY